MTEAKIPLIVLAGRDRNLAEVADNGRGRRPLQGYKGAEIKIGDRPLIQLLVDRMAGCGVFDPIWVAGPERVYGPWLKNAGIIDTDGTFGQNLRFCVEHLRKESRPRMLAVTTCDILPDADELAEVMADFRRLLPTLDFWMPQIHVPEDPESLGASDWKPRYRLVPRKGEPSVPVLPGHMIICDPEAVRLTFVYRFFDILYRTRNRSLSYRRWMVTRELLWGLFIEDFRRLVSLRMPTVAATVIYSSLLMASKLKAGTATVQEMEVHIRRALIQRRHRRRFPDKRGRVLLCPAMSLAKDIDTVEEARELERQVSRDEPPLA